MRNSVGRLRSRGQQPIQRLPRRPRRVLGLPPSFESETVAVNPRRSMARGRSCRRAFIRRSLSRTGLPDVTGRHAMLSTETSIKVGEISEADAISDGADRAIGKLQVAQHTIGVG